MTIEYGNDIFTLMPGESIGLSTIFHSSDFNAGGEYLGPLVVAPAAVNSPNQTLTPSTVGLEWKAQSGEFTTNVVYHYSVQNNGSLAASFVLHFFND